ncbi:MAG TPA: hypothetical protein VIL69_04005 [Roseomonas sp.]|jgi:hypothetical protein
MPLEISFGLTADPFDPPGSDGERLNGRALRIDQDGALERLFCPTLAGIAEGTAQVRQAIWGANEANGPPRRAAICLVLGIMGSGKTTFAAKVVKQVMGCPAPRGDGDWSTHEVSFPRAGAPVDPLSMRQHFAALQEILTRAHGNAPASAIVFVRNLPAGGIDELVDLYNAFAPRIFMVIVATTSDDSLKNKELYAYGPRMVLVERGRADEADVRRFMEWRLDKFRSEPILQPLAIEPDLQLFPFDASVPATVAGSGGRSLRAVGHNLSLRLETAEGELGGIRHVCECTAAELRQRLIR